jgi:hypothetical protein
MLPSSDAINGFLFLKAIRTLVVVQQDSVTGELEGFTVLTKGDLSSQNPIPIKKNDLFVYSGSRRYNLENPDKLLGKLASKYDFRYEFIPAPGYKVPSEMKRGVGWRFIKDPATMLISPA